MFGRDSELRLRLSVMRSITAGEDGFGLNDFHGFADIALGAYFSLE